MANWSTPEQAEKAIAEEYERKWLWEKWKSGELYEERKREREVLERVDRLAKRTMWPWLKIATISAYSWAEDHPELTIRHGGRLYCRDEAYRPRFAPPSIEREGKEYVTVRELACRRGVTRVSARAWAKWVKNHPHLAMKVGGYWYARDEEWKPRTPRETPERRPVTHPAGMSGAARRRGV